MVRPAVLRAVAPHALRQAGRSAGLKRVLFHSYHFPPTGGSGSQRPANMVRHLPRFGYEPVVVTAPGPREERWTPADDALRAHVPADTIVRRLPGPEPASSSGWRNRAQRWLRLRDPWTRSWIGGSVPLGIETANAADVDLVYAWMQPYASAEAASAISRAIRKPWVADLGDPWALDEMMIYPTGLHRSLERRLMRTVLGTAAAVVLSTDEAAERLLAAFPEFEGKIVTTIPNGFDADEFAEPPPMRSDDSFRIVHAGYLHTELGYHQHRSAPLRKVLGGGVDGVDILGRSPVYLIEAIERVRREHPTLADKLEVHFAGVLSADDVAVVRSSPATRILGFLSHDESRELIRSADLLFLPMHDLPEGERASVVPGKTYAYLASGRPILAAIPAGDAHDLLAAAGTAYLCAPKDVAAMTQAIIQAYERTRLDVPRPQPPADLLERYEYRHLAERLAHVFDRVVATESAAVPLGG